MHLLYQLTSLLAYHCDPNPWDEVCWGQWIRGRSSAAAAFGCCSAAASSNPLAVADFVPGIGVAMVRKQD